MKSINKALSLLVVLSFGSIAQAGDLKARISKQAGIHMAQIKDFAIVAAHNGSKQLLNLGASLDFFKQTLQAHGDKVVNAVSSFEYRNPVAKAGIVSGLALMQYALLKKASFSKDQAFWNIMNDSNFVSRRTVVPSNGHHDIRDVKLVFNTKNEAKALKLAEYMNQSNNKGSLRLGLVGAALAAAGYLYHR